MISLLSTEIPPEFQELSERYGEKFNKSLLKLLKHIASESIVSIDAAVLASAYCPTYKTGRNPARDGMHIVEWASKSTHFKNNTSTRFENMLKEENSVLLELLYLGVIWRDEFIVGEKYYDYVFLNLSFPTIFRMLVELTENDIVQPIKLKKVKADYVPVLKTYSHSLGLDVEPTELVKRVIECVPFTEIPKLGMLPRLASTTRRDLASEYKDISSTDDKFLLPNSFKLSYTGRIFIRDRSFKAVGIKAEDKGNFYDTLYGVGNYHNYDINASQLSLIPGLAKKLGINKDNYEQPIQTVKDLLDSCDEVLGIPRKVVKSCLYSIMFSAPGRQANFYSSSFGYIRKHYVELGALEQESYKKADFTLSKLKLELSEFTVLLDDLKNRLDEKLIKEQPEFIENKVTRINYKLFFKALEKDNQNRKGKQLSLFIQSSEAAFLYNLIVLCANNGIKTLSSEYDGVVTDKPIPDSLFEEASKLSGEGNISMSEKPFSNNKGGVK